VATTRAGRLPAALAVLVLAACDARAPNAVVLPTPAASAVIAAATAPPVASPAASAPPAPAPTASVQVEAPRGLLVPVAGIARSELRDNYEQARGGARHEAIDIMAPRGTPVVAVADGRVVKLFTSVPGGLTVYQFDTTNRLAYYYAHLDRYAETLHEGMLLKAGDPVGFVGSSGNAAADAPHLHFAIFELGPEKQWWKGTPINPYPLLAETPR
jgi:murein DD-endopeptidase MepM/ murein hydrolase activator NlpD